MTDALSNASLGGSDVSETDLTGANLTNADLTEANLTGATGVTTESLEQQAKALKNAIMPDSLGHR